MAVTEFHFSISGSMTFPMNNFQLRVIIKIYEIKTGV